MQLSNAPAQLVEAWATGDSSKTNPIPVPSQIGVTPGAASWTDGFPPLCDTPLVDGGIPPAKADMNGGLYQMSAVDVWMCAGAGFPYNAGFQTAIGGYPKGARVLMASGAGYWVSTTDNNMTDPDTGGSGWAADDNGGITALTGPVTASGPGSAGATITPTGVTPGSYIGADITVNAAGQITAASNGFTSGNNSNGYWVKDPTGKIEQWGVATTNGGGSPNITFPIPFTNSGSVNIQATPGITDLGATNTLNVLSLSTTQAAIGANASASGIGMYWHAVGF